jgi:hypothetical protein
VNLKFLPVSRRVHRRNFKFINRTRIIKLLVLLVFPKFAREVAAKRCELRKRSTSRADLLSLGVALPLMIAPLPAGAGENDDVLKVVDDICLNDRDNVNEVARKVSKLPFKQDPVAIDRGPPVVRGTWLPKLGTGSILTFSAKRASATLSDCKLVSHVPELADLVDRLKAKFDLGEPKTSDSSVQLTMKGQKTINGKPHEVELVYGFEENKPSGAFTLTINR